MGELTTDRAYPAHWEADVVLADGATARMRPVSPHDAQALQQMHQHQSQDSIYFRYFTYKSSLSAKELERFTVVDYRDRVAFVILHGDELLGIGRYDRLPNSYDAEVAFNIADRHSGRGLASILMEHLAEAARENGIRRFVADVLPENQKMLSVFQAAGFDIKRSFEDGVIVVEFPLDETAKTRAVMESREHRAEAKSLGELLRAESIAVIGASRDWGSVGYALMENIIEGKFTGPVYGINPEALELAGMISLGSIAEAPGDVDVAVIAVPDHQLDKVIRDCAAKGVRGLVVVSDLSAQDTSALDRQRQLVSLARSYGMRLIGPASAGIISTDPEVSLNASVAAAMPKRGSIGLFSQSAALSANLYTESSRRGIGVSSVISAGNRADVSGNDAMQYFEDDPYTSAVGIYLESFGNPRKFSRIGRRLSRKKPVVLASSPAMGRRLSPGHSTRTTQAPLGTVESMLDQAGVIQTNSTAHMMDVLQVLACQPVPGGDRLGVIGNAVAINELVAESAEMQGLKVTRRDAVSGLPEDHTVEQAFGAFSEAIEQAVESQQVDTVLVCVQSAMTQLPGDARELANQLGEIAADTDVTVLACFTAVLDQAFTPTGVFGAGTYRERTEAEAAEEITLSAQHGLPVFSTPESALKVIAQLTRYQAWRDADQGKELEYSDLDRHRAVDLVTEWAQEAVGTDLLALDQHQTAELLACYGISVLESRGFSTADEAVAAAEELGFPVALKAVDANLRHRLDLGGVRLNIVDAESLRGNVAQMREVLTRYGSPELEVQSMAPAGQGCTVVAVEDPLLGPVVSFGISGDAVELLHDWVHMVPPLTSADLERMVRTPRAAAKLFGYGGLRPADIHGVKEVLGRLSILAHDLPQVVRVRFSPLLASEDNVSVLQAEVQLANAARRTDSARRALSG
ncbi:GNAT family N-acetyltransferase [Auritidibacter ignavus]|uniref:bifunctional acetate--CoA ligase family protein/GNAT family N-acetyltransferase n=1 Tax=Auritidibacter ignavus TaxID=678932 RepID=UPI00244C97A4|nr:bifunctional GNAT family N-acetyltransferase/acetate--CoA ligase family protein [Auritidibacter ignavus]WGH91505.1 GNAT family N-acetyltransferase [Auritidibacter ignavus]